jgi:hypothetical protein
MTRECFKLMAELELLCATQQDVVKETLEDNELEVVSALHSYGLRAPLWDSNGNNYKYLMKEARAYSAELDDPQAYEEAMSRPVNAIGSTAREFGQGDIQAALYRNTDDPNTQLMRKLHGLPADCDTEIPAERSIGLQVQTNKVPSDDPLAYVMGYMAALSGRGMDGPRDELAEAYLEGYQFGVGVKGGQESIPRWHN